MQNCFLKIWIAIIVPYHEYIFKAAVSLNFMLEAFYEKDSKGRKYAIDTEFLMDNLPAFDRDFEMISSSKALRRLAGKTQVFKIPNNPHVRTRRIHTDEVRQVSKIISHNLGLNNSLCQAIALGHDLGHTPYGHLGERTLKEMSGKNFRHNVFGVVVAQEIEKRGLGLNLSYETLEGILLHSRGSEKINTSGKAAEYDAVMYADKIGYTFADINDAIRYGYLNEKDLPAGIRELGGTQTERIDSCIRGLVGESLADGKVSFSKCREAQIFGDIKDHMYKHVYNKIDDDIHKKFLENTYKTLEREYPGVDPAIGLALMTDWEVDSIGRITLGPRKPNINDFDGFGINEVLPYIDGKKIDYTNPGLDWGKNR